ncbi:winged helix-turn-helix transcriptional regulator [Candidatus Wolfebacteria bacterium]|nr:winged helix-turn-helix transcriptional regulator [Candidatus Wolfebacteria bacterium]
MDYLFLIIVGLIGVGIGTYLGKQRVKLEKEWPGFIEAQLEKKRSSKEEILNFIKTHERITNNNVEEILGVSDSTATRYLDQLEEEGLIRQVGERGRGVYYELK